jgi:putative transposase
MIHQPAIQDIAGCYFFTIRLAPQSGDLLVRHIETLRAAMRYMLGHHPTQINAIAVLPNVIHALWTLPAGDNDYPNRIGMLKSRFSKAMDTPAHRTLSQIQKGQKGIWERRYWGHQIRDLDDFNRHRDLIHLSPVHARLCATPQDWPHSSIHRDTRHGLLPPRALPEPEIHQPLMPTAQSALPLGRSNSL